MRLEAGAEQREARMLAEIVRQFEASRRKTWIVKGVFLGVPHPRCSCKRGGKRLKRKEIGFCARRKSAQASEQKGVSDSGQVSCDDVVRATREEDGPEFGGGTPSPHVFVRM